MSEINAFPIFMINNFLKTGEKEKKSLDTHSLIQSDFLKRLFWSNDSKDRLTFIF